MVSFEVKLKDSQNIIDSNKKESEANIKEFSFFSTRNPTLKHVPRVHRVNIDATYERIREDPGIYMRHWPIEYQMADILTKGSFTKGSMG